MTTKRQHYLPYAYAERGLELDVRGVRTSDEPVDLDLILDPEGRSLDLRDYAHHTNPLHIDLEVHGLDDALFAEVLPESERRDPPLRFVAILRDSTGWYRVVAPLTRTNEGSVTGSIDFSPLESTGFAGIEVVAIRTRRGGSAAAPGYAMESGMRVATAPPLELYTRDRPQLPGGSLDIRWEDFAASTHPQRRKRSDRVYYLESTAEPPILWLNQAIPDLPTVLESKGTTGRQALVRELINQAIAGPAWYGLLHTAFLSVSLDEEERPTLPEGWRHGLIARVAPRLYPALSRDRAYRRLLDGIYEVQHEHDLDGGVVLIESLVAAIQDELDLPRITRRALKELGR